MSSEPRSPYDLWSFPMPQAGAPTPPAGPPTTAYAPPAGPPPPPSSSTPPHPPAPKRPASRLQRWRVAAACVLGLALGAAGMSVVDFVRSPTAEVSVTAPAVDRPIVDTPATTPTTTPSTQAPRTTTPSSSASGGSSTAAATGDLTVGLVNINTVLGFEGAQAAGTGIVLSADGKVLTNNHVIEGSTEIEVTVVATGKSYPAKVVGTAPSDDVALLQLQGASGLAVAPLGDSSKVKVGDAVVGIGNAGGTGVPTRSAGAVTALGQTITATDQSGGNAETLHNLIEISAQLQPGQSGGPLYDASGRVIGVDSAGSTGGGFGGRSRFGGGTGGTTQGYAIPINDALSLVKQIEQGQESDRITIGTPPMLGISAGDAATGGVIVSGVTSGTPAAKIGLQPGDVIVSIDGTKVATVSDLSAVLGRHEVGDKVAVSWTRNGTTKSGTATLIAGPAN